MAKQVKRVALSNSARQLPKGSKVVGKADREQRMEISIRIRAKRSGVLDDDTIFATAAEPTSRRQYLSREDFAARAGADPADVDKIDEFAHRYGLNVKSVHLHREP